MYHLPKIHVSRMAYDAIMTNNPTFLRGLFESGCVASSFWGVSGVTIHAESSVINEIEHEIESVLPLLGVNA